MKLIIVMAERRAIAIIGIPTLAAIGIKNLILTEYDVRVVTYASFDDFRSFEESADGFIVNAELFVINLDYFMPRRQKTLLYGSFLNCKIEETRNIIQPYDDETQIGEKICGLVESVTRDRVVPGELSAREKEVLRLLVSGKINKEIADELCISINTVITHRKNITVKTGIKSVSGLSIYALMNGIS